MKKTNLKDLLIKKITEHLKMQRKMGKSLDDIKTTINQLVDTIFIISSLEKGDVRVLQNRADANGVEHNISEYEVCPQFERLCTSRGVYFDDSDFAFNLKANSYSAKVGELKSKSKDKVTGSPEIDCRTVPLTPAEFKSEQIRVINIMKGNIDHWTSIDEVTKPILLSSVKLISDGDATTDPNGDWSVLPEEITIAKDIYKAYKFVLPIEEYADLFAMNFVSNLG